MFSKDMLSLILPLASTRIVFTMIPAFCISSASSKLLRPLSKMRLVIRAYLLFSAGYLLLVPTFESHESVCQNFFKRP